jgi:hypothetical protein
MAQVYSRQLKVESAGIETARDLRLWQARVNAHVPTVKRSVPSPHAEAQRFCDWVRWQKAAQPEMAGSLKPSTVCRIESQAGITKANTGKSAKN